MAEIDTDRPSLRAVVNATDLHRGTGDVLALVERGPVGISKHGKTRYVVVDIERYDAMLRAADPRLAFKTEDLPDDLADVLMRELDLIIGGDQTSDDAA
jgi:prevent-host-death family protein